MEKIRSSDANTILEVLMRSPASHRTWQWAVYLLIIPKFMVNGNIDIELFDKLTSAHVTASEKAGYKCEESHPLPIVPK